MIWNLETHTHTHAHTQEREGRMFFAIQSQWRNISIDAQFIDFNFRYRIFYNYIPMGWQFEAPSDLTDGNRFASYLLVV